MSKILPKGPWEKEFDLIVDKVFPDLVWVPGAAERAFDLLEAHDNELRDLVRRLSDALDSADSTNYSDELLAEARKALE